MKGYLTAFAALVLLVAGAHDASAQFRIGPAVAWGDEMDLAIGARATSNLNTNVLGNTGPLHAILGFDYFVDCESCTYFEVSPGVYIPFTVRSAGPFAGLALNIRRFSSDLQIVGADASDTDLGLALFGGLQFPIAGQMAMADARLAVGGSGQLVITLAWLFGRGSSESPN
jgi:hypothetical protein